jgi:predicted nucleic acid-binding protein
VIAFFDASALIYLIEGKALFADQVKKQLKVLEKRHPALGAAVSRLTWLECRGGSMKANNFPILAAFDTFFSRQDLLWVELTRDVVELATVIRVKHGLRTPDSLQAACCLQLGAKHVFLTGDATFARVAGLNVKVLASH